MMRACVLASVSQPAACRNGLTGAMRFLSVRVPTKASLCRAARAGTCTHPPCPNSAHGFGGGRNANSHRAFLRTTSLSAGDFADTVAGPAMLFQQHCSTSASFNSCSSIRHLPSDTFLVLSVFQMVCSLVALTLTCVTISQRAFQHELGAGLWAGSLMLAAGLHGILTSRRKNICMLVTLLVLCVLAALSAALLACLSAAGIVMDNMSRVVHMRHVVLHTLLLLVGLLETAVAVASAVITARQVCCAPDLALDSDLQNLHVLVDEPASAHCPAITPLSSRCYLLNTVSQVWIQTRNLWRCCFTFLLLTSSTATLNTKKSHSSFKDELFNEIAG